MNAINKDTKIKIIASYIGACNISMKFEDAARNYIDILGAFHLEVIRNNYQNWVQDPFLSLTESKIIVKDINCITEGEAYELAKILGECRGDDFTKELIQKSILRILDGTHSMAELIKHHRFVHAAQYLQSKGYAIPYMDYSVSDLVDLGIYELIS